MASGMVLELPYHLNDSVWRHLKRKADCLVAGELIKDRKRLESFEREIKEYPF